jgi:MoaA/NifB/PqqE/SkfB family radical SAM enzyme
VWTHANYLCEIVIAITPNTLLGISKAIRESPASRINWVLRVLPTNRFVPEYVQIESTTKCNMKCKTCIRSEKENYDIDMDFFKSIIDQLRWSRFGTLQVDLTGVGEPFLNTNLVSMVEYAKRFGFKIGFTTNLTVLNESIAEELVNKNLDYLYVSFDGATKETFEKLRIGANFEKVISNIKMLLKKRSQRRRSRPLIKLTATISYDNSKEIPDLIKIAEDLKVNSINFNRQIIPEKEHWKHEFRPVAAWKQRAKVAIGRMAIPLKRPQPCVALKGCYITYDGKVLPCNSLIQILPRKEYYRVQVGDLKHNTLNEIWFSKNYRLFRTHLALGRQPFFCNYCPRPYQM